MKKTTDKIISSGCHKLSPAKKRKERKERKKLDGRQKTWEMRNQKEDY